MKTGYPPFHKNENQYQTMINIAEAKEIDIPDNISRELKDFLR